MDLNALKEKCLLNWVELILKKSDLTLDHFKDGKILLQLLDLSEEFDSDSTESEPTKAFLKIEDAINKFYNISSAEFLHYEAVMNGSSQMSTAAVCLLLLTLCLQSRGKATFMNAAFDLPHNLQVEVMQMTRDLLSPDADKPITMETLMVLSREADSSGSGMSSLRSSASEFGIVWHSGEFAPTDSTLLERSASPPLAPDSQGPSKALFVQRSMESISPPCEDVVPTFCSPLPFAVYARLDSPRQYTNSPLTPLKNYLNSPQMVQKSKLREKERAYRRLQVALENERHLRADTETELALCRKQLEDENNRVHDLERRLSRESSALHRVRDEMEEVAALKEEMESYRLECGRLKTKVSEWQEITARNEHLDKENKELYNKIAELRNKVHSSQRKQARESTSVSDLSVTVNLLRDSLREADAKIQKLIEEREEAEVKLSLESERRFELQQQMDDSFTYSMRASIGSPTVGERMSVVPEKRISELEGELEEIHQHYDALITREREAKEAALESLARKEEEIESLKSQQINLQTQYADIEGNLEDCLLSLQSLNEELAAAKATAESKEVVIGELHREIVIRDEKSSVALQDYNSRLEEKEVSLKGLVEQLEALQTVASEEKKLGERVREELGRRLEQSNAEHREVQMLYAEVNEKNELLDIQMAAVEREAKMLKDRLADNVELKEQVETQLASVVLAREELEGQLKVTEAEFQQLKEEIATLLSEKEGLLMRIEELEDRERTLRCQLDKQVETSYDIRSKLVESQAEKSELETKLARTEETLRFMEEKLSENIEANTALQDQLREGDEVKATLEVRLRESGEENEKLTSAIDDQLQLRVAVEEEMQGVIAAKELISAQLADSLKKREEVEKALMDVNDDKGNIIEQLHSTKVSHAEEVDRMQDRLEQTTAQLHALQDELEAAEKAARQLTEDLDKAEEAYSATRDEVKKRECETQKLETANNVAFGDIEKLTSELELMKQSRDSAVGEVMEARTQLSTTYASLMKAKEEMTVVSNDLDQVGIERNLLRAHLSVTASELKKTQSLHELTMSQLDEKQGELTATRETLVGLEERLTVSEAELKLAQSERDSIKNAMETDRIHSEATALRVQEESAHQHDEIVKELEDTRKSLTEEIVRLNTRLAETQSLEEAQETEVTAMQEHATVMEREVARLLAERDAKEMEMHERVEQVEGDCLRAESEVETMTREMEKYQKQVYELEKRLESANEEVAAGRKEREELFKSSRASRGKMETEVDRLHRAVESKDRQLGEEVHRLRNEVEEQKAISEEYRRAYEEEVTELQEELVEKDRSGQQQIESISLELEQLREEQERSSYERHQERETLKAGMAHLEREREELTQEVERLSKALSEYRDTNTSLKARAQTLDDRVAELQTNAEDADQLGADLLTKSEEAVRLANEKATLTNQLEDVRKDLKEARETEEKCVGELRRKVVCLEEEVLSKERCWEELEEDLGRLREENGDLRNQLDDSTIEGNARLVDQLSNEKAALDARLKELEVEVEVGERNLQQAVTNVERLTHRVTSVQSECEDWQRASQQYKSDLGKTRDLLQEVLRREEHVKTTLQTSKRDAGALREAMEDLEARREREKSTAAYEKQQMEQDFQMELKTYQSRISALNSRISSMEEEWSRLESQTEEWKTRCHSMEVLNQELDERLHQVNTELDSKKALLQEATNAMQVEQQLKERFRRQAIDLESEFSPVKRRSAQLAQENNALRSRVTALESDVSMKHRRHSLALDSVLRSRSRASLSGVEEELLGQSPCFPGTGPVERFTERDSAYPLLMAGGRSRLSTSSTLGDDTLRQSRSSLLPETSSVQHREQTSRSLLPETSSVQHREQTSRRHTSPLVERHLYPETSRAEESHRLSLAPSTDSAMPGVATPGVYATATTGSRGVSTSSRRYGGLFSCEDEPSPDVMEWKRISELQRRNTAQPLHMRTSYPVETQVCNPRELADLLTTGSAISLPDPGRSCAVTGQRKICSDLDIPGEKRHTPHELSEMLLKSASSAASSTGSLVHSARGNSNALTYWTQQKHRQALSARS